MRVYNHRKPTASYEFHFNEWTSSQRSLYIETLIQYSTYLFWQISYRQDTLLKGVPNSCWRRREANFAPFGAEVKPLTLPSRLSAGCCSTLFYVLFFFLCVFSIRFFILIIWTYESLLVYFHFGSNPVFS